MDTVGGGRLDLLKTEKGRPNKKKGKHAWNFVET